MATTISGLSGVDKIDIPLDIFAKSDRTLRCGPPVTTLNMYEEVI